MEALQKAKLALRAHLLANKSKVLSDLDAMRKKSEGNDIFKYVEGLSSALSVQSFNVSTEVTFDYSFSQVDCYDIVNQMINNILYSPPEKEKSGKLKKGSEKISGSFFFW